MIDSILRKIEDVDDFNDRCKECGSLMFTKHDEDNHLTITKCGNNECENHYHPIIIKDTI